MKHIKSFFTSAVFIALFVIGVYAQKTPMAADSWFRQSVSLKVVGKQRLDFVARAGASAEGRVLSDGKTTYVTAAANPRGISGVKVSVRSQDAGFGNFVVESFTDTSGSYKFESLKPGKYSIEIDAEDLPARFRAPNKFNNPNNATRKTATLTMTVIDGPSGGEPARPVRNSGSVMDVGRHLKGYTTGNPLFDSYILDASLKYNIDPLLIVSQMDQESSFKVRALSNKGASGLMQLMPATARRLGVSEIYDPKQNIEGGVKYMRILLDMFGQNVDLALAGYNAGEGAVIRYGYQIPPYKETRDYVRRISGRYRSISNTTGVFRWPPHTINDRRVTVSKYRTEAVTVHLPGGGTRLTNR